VEPESDISPAHIGGFRVLRRLSSGATTDVLLARAEGPHGFERVVALKVLLQQFQSDPSFERMFAREASAYARLSHPAIVKLYDFFSSGGQLVMVLEYVDGLPLHKLRAMLSIGGERLEDGAALFIGSRIFAALGAAHSARDPENGEFAPVIHRDINPANVLVPWDGHVKISDFGMAKIGGTQDGTRLGFVKGTYGYMAPEQVRGENVTVRADVYAATLVLWELLARRKAIQRGALPEVEVLKAMAKPQFPSLDALRPELSAEVRDAVRRGLEPEPDRRGITADEMAGVLRLAMSGDEGRARLADAIARVRPAPTTDDGLAVTRAHPTHASLTDIAEGRPRTDLMATVRQSPDETTRISTQTLPDDSGAFKRTEMAIESLGDTLGTTRVDEPPESSGDLTVVEARRPTTSEPPATLPPSSEPGTLSPETLPLPLSETGSAWRGPAQGFARTEPVPQQPQTLRFGPSEPPPPTAPDPKPPEPLPVAPGPPSPRVSAGPPSSPRSSRPSPPPSSKRTLSSAAPPSAPRHAPDPNTTLTSPTSAPFVATPPRPDSPPPSTPRPSPSSPRPPPSTPRPPAPAVSAQPVVAPPPAAPTPPEPPLPRFPMPSVEGIPAAAHTPLPPQAPEVIAPSSPPPAPAAALRAGPTQPTVRTTRVRKSSSFGVVVGVVIGSALLGVGAVELYLRMQAPDEVPPLRATTSAPATGHSATPTTAAAPQASASARPAAPPPATSRPQPPASATPVVGTPPGPSGPAASSAPTAPAPAPAAPTPPPDPTARPAGSDPQATAAGTGQLLTKASAGGHRIFVDDKVAGNSPDPVSVSCGKHTVRVGSAGTPRDVEVPCGGAIVVTP
jgi:eukaryotic-like serine/threonine-protein kinase